MRQVGEAIAASPLVCAVGVIDLSRPISDVPTGGAAGLHLLVTLDGRPMGTVEVPAAVDPVPAETLVDVLTQRFADAVDFAERRGKALGEIPQPIRRPLTVSVLVASRDRPESLHRCLAAIAAQDFAFHEVVVVDNASASSRTREVVEAAGCRWVPEPVPGLDRARNRGILATSGDILVMTDDDVEVQPGWAGHLQACFQDPLVMASTGLVLAAQMPTAAAVRFEVAAGFSRGFSRLVLDGSVQSPYGAGRAGAGASMAFRRDFLLAVGGFPEELDGGTSARSGGDTYMLAEVLRHGFRIVYEPSALARHHHRTTTADLEATVRGYGTGSASWLASAAVRHRDPAALWIGGRNLSGYLARKVVRAQVPHPSAPPSGLAALEVKGVLDAAKAWPAARREAAQRDPLLRPQPALMPNTSDLAGGSEPPPSLDRDAPDLSVVIPSRGRRDRLRRLLGALQAQVHCSAVEVVVVLDGDIDGSREMLQGWDSDIPVRIVDLPSDSTDPSQGNGAAAARNAGLAQAHGPIVLFLDDDVVPATPHLLAAHAAAHGSGPPAVAIGPVFPTLTDTGSLMGVRLRNWWADHAMALLGSSERHFADICTGNMSVPLDTIVRMGGFADVPRREDWEFGWRVLSAQMPVRVLPQAGVTHDVDADLGVILRDRQREGAGDALFLQRHPDAYPWLLLSGWDDMAARRRETLLMAMDRPERASRLVAVASTALGVAEWSGHRGRHQRWMGKLMAVAYWTGVGQAAGGSAGWLDLLARCRAQPENAVIWELNDTARPLPVPGASGLIRMTHGGLRIADALPRWGGIPFDRAAVVDALFSRGMWWTEPAP